MKFLTLQRKATKSSYAVFTMTKSKVRPRSRVDLIESRELSKSVLVDLELLKLQKLWSARHLFGRLARAGQPDVDCVPSSYGQGHILDRAFDTYTCWDVLSGQLASAE